VAHETSGAGGGGEETRSMCRAGEQRRKDAGALSDRGARR
jgi:hypothetical protein